MSRGKRELGGRISGRTSGGIRPYDDAEAATRARRGGAMRTVLVPMARPDGRDPGEQARHRGDLPQYLRAVRLLAWLFRADKRMMRIQHLDRWPTRGRPRSAPPSRAPSMSFGNLTINVIGVRQTEKAQKMFRNRWKRHVTRARDADEKGSGPGQKPSYEMCCLFQCWTRHLSTPSSAKRLVLPRRKLSV